MTDMQVENANDSQLRVRVEKEVVAVISPTI